MASLDDLLSYVPLASIAQRLGVDEATARSAVHAAVPTLLGGMHANAADEPGEASLSNALGDHADLLDHETPLDHVDTAEGEKIVHNLFGDNTDQVVHALGASPETGAKVTDGLVAKVMPMLAPIVMAYVARQMGNKMRRGGGQAAAEGGQAASGGGLGNLLGGLLGGNKGGGLGNVLGGLLGEGKK